MNVNRDIMLEPVINTPDDVQNSAFVQNFWGDSQAFVVSTGVGAEFSVPLGAGATEGANFQIWLSGPYGAGQKRTFKQLTLDAIGPLLAVDIATGYLGLLTDSFYSYYGVQDGTSGKLWTAGCRQYSKSIFSVPTLLVAEVDGSDP